MSSVTFAVDEQLKKELDPFTWVNWSNVVAEEVEKDLKRAAALEKALKIVLKSKFTNLDADLLSDKVKTAMHQKLQQEGNTKKK